MCWGQKYSSLISKNFPRSFCFKIFYKIIQITIFWFPIIIRSDKIEVLLYSFKKGMNKSPCSFSRCSNQCIINCFNLRTDQAMHNYA